MSSGATEEDDVTLLHAARTGDEAAFAALVTRYHNKLLLFARLMVGELWAEEVVQDAWVSVYRAIDSFEGRSTFQTWLYTVVKNQARNLLRKESKLFALTQLSTPLSPAGQFTVFCGVAHAGSLLCTFHVARV